MINNVKDLINAPQKLMESIESTIDNRKWHIDVYWLINEKTTHFDIWCEDKNIPRQLFDKTARSLLKDMHMELNE